jgi:lipoprotein-releasing system ATP-binding protein
MPERSVLARGIRKSYPTPSGPLEVLSGVDLEVSRGTIHAVLGASGVGKSTLLNILGTLDRADSGTLEVRGRRLDQLSGRELAEFRSRAMGFVFQFHHLLPEFNALENVMMPLLIAGSRDVASARAGCATWGSTSWEHHPSELGRRGARVAVARALAPEPELVLADEPSGNRDPRNAAALHELIASLAHERHQTFVVVTHNDTFAARADRVLTLAGGVLQSS